MKVKISKILMVLLIINMINPISNFFTLNVQALNKGIQYKYVEYEDYCQIGSEYVSIDNNITVVVNDLELIDRGKYNQYKITYTETNNTDTRQDVGSFEMFFYDRGSLLQYGIFGTLMPGERITKTYIFEVLKTEMPWMLTYSKVGEGSVNVDGRLKWDITPEDLKGKSPNTNLSEIKTSSGDIVVVEDKYTYDINVSNATEYITINPIGEDDKATVEGGGTFNLEFGNNTFVITVTAEMGNRKQYNLNVNRQSANADLSSISVSHGQLEPAFSPDINEYTLKLDKQGYTLSIRPQAADSKAKVKGQQSFYMNYYEPFTATFDVIAEDGTTNQYNINVIPPSRDASLKQIVLNDGDILIDIVDGTRKYKATVGGNVNKVKIDGITLNENAKIISGVGTFDIKEGSNNFYIEVEAEESGYRQGYDLEIYKANDDTNLTDIKIGYGGRNYSIYGFSSDITQYKLEEKKLSEELTISAVPASYRSKIEYWINGERTNIIYGEIGKHLVIGENIVDIKVISEGGAEKIYTLNLTYRNLGTNNKLDELEFDTGTLEPKFNPSITEYKLYVPRGTYSVGVTATPKDKYAFVANSGDNSFSDYIQIDGFEKVVNFVVKAEEDSYGKPNRKTYIVKIIKEVSSEAILRSVNITYKTSETGGIGWDIDYKKGQKTAEFTVPEWIDKVELVPWLGDYVSNFEGFGTKTLNIGENIFKFKVTAEDKVTTKEYTLNIKRRGGLIPAERISGPSRYETAVQIFNKGWKSADTAILVTGQNYPDALSATPLAAKYDAPILLASNASLKYQPELSNVLRNKGVKNVIIIGSEGIIPKGIEGELANMGITSRRIAGNDRYETSLAIAKEVGINSGEIVVASGQNFPDGLSIASIAAKKQMPILLIREQHIPGNTKAYMDSANISKTYLLGSEGLIPNSVASQLKNVERLAGKDRYATNENIFNRFKYELNLSHLYIASSLDFPDALATSALAAKTNSFVVLSYPTYAAATLKSIVNSSKDTLDKVYVIGSRGLIPDDIFTSAGIDIIK